MDNEVRDAQSAVDDILDNLVKECKADGDVHRSKMGVDECFAIINHHRDSELNIQVLSIIFLPGSLVSSIFGMGFFPTSPRPSFMLAASGGCTLPCRCR